MGETQNLRNTRIEKYDPLYGRFVRDIKTTDIIIVGAKEAPTSADTATTGWDMTSTVVDTDHALYPYIFTVHSTNTAAQFIVLNDSTTALSLQVDSLRTESLVTDCECPLMRVAPSSTVTIHIPYHLITNTTDTWAAFLVCKKEPLVAVVEN